MSFRIRWIFLLLCAFLFISFLIINRLSCVRSPCAACVQHDDARGDIDGDQLKEVNLPHVVDPRVPVKTSKIHESSSHQAIVAAVHDDKLHEDRRETWDEGQVVDCVMWDEKLKYNIKNLSLQEFSAGTYSKRSEGIDKRRKTFQTIFKKRDWPAPNDTSYTGLKASGPGATLHNAQRVIAVLHSVVSHLKTHLGKKKISILDVPCGDLQWMSRWLDTRWDIDYTGVDIVPDIIEDHKKTFRRIQNAEFFVLDIVSEKLNRSFDLILCRDMLQHLWLSDALTTLQRLSGSGSGFLLVTTFTDTGHNEDVDISALGGRHYSYNLELPPFSLPPPICIGYDWNIEHLGLWSLPLKQVVHR